VLGRGLIPLASGQDESMSIAEIVDNIFSQECNFIYLHLIGSLA
jgi:hypothetical protein